MLIEKIFTAYPRTAREYLSRGEQGCYIPSYQRPFSWGKADLDRVIEDISRGLEYLAETSGSLHFFGAIIAVHTTSNPGIPVEQRPQLPGSVMVVIDGQQRLSTLLLLNTALHEYIADLCRRLNKYKETVSAVTWLLDVADTELKNLKKALLIDKEKQGEYRFYPRLIRAGDDVWSWTKGTARYVSPIASLLFQYSRHISRPSGTEGQSGAGGKAGKGDKFEPFKLVVPDTSKLAFQTTVDAFDHLKNAIRALCAGKERDQPPLPTAEILLDNQNFREVLWSSHVPDEAKTFSRERSDHKAYDVFSSLVVAVAFSRYAGERLVLTEAVTTTEDYAFDIFEALNTTGQPLTAFETFKPRLVEEAGLEEWGVAETKKWVDVVERRLNNFPKAEQRQKATSDLLIPFALSETGEKLSRHLNEQRRYLRKEYDGLGEGEPRAEFIRSLAELSEFIETCWEAPPAALQGAAGDVDLGRVCLDFLTQMNHSIVLALLARFHSLCFRSDVEKIEDRWEPLLSAIKAVTAFSVLWRASRSTTGGIDGHYRDLLRKGRPTVGVSPFCRRPRDQSGTVALMGLRKALCDVLVEEGGVADRKAWIELVSTKPLYQISAPLTRFLLILATHDSVPKKDKSGQLDRGRPGVLPVLKWEPWSSGILATVEHVAPQGGNNGSWDSSLYKSPDMVHTLGNLTLLPAAENQVVGARPWAHKQVYYRLLSSKTNEEFEGIRVEAQKSGLLLSIQAENVMGKATYLPLCESLGLVDEPWNATLAIARSRNLAGLAWDILSSWLPISSQDDSESDIANSEESA